LDSENEDIQPQESAVTVTEEEPSSDAPPPSEVRWQRDHKLLKRYTDARRDEHEVIAKLVDTLSRVDNLPEEQLEQVRDALFHTDYPFLLVLVGPFSAGKSSIINALLGERVVDVGPVPTTDHIHILRHGGKVQHSRAGETTTVFHPNPLLESLSFVDTPGLESVFEKHDKVTRSFLHRADLVLLVMVATHVLSASNLNFLQELKTYGKRTIIVVNQIDVLDESERDTVRTFVEDQSRLHLGVEPQIWMVSAKQALEAYEEEPRDEILYDSSGMAEVEEYIVNTLNDAARIRQKLETSMQIASNVRGAADELVDANKNALTEHQKTLKNIEAQITEAQRAQTRNVADGIDEINRHWAEAAQRGSEAIRDLFQFSRAFGQIFSGIGEITGLAALIRRFGGRTRAEAAFERHEVTAALEKVPGTVDRLGARLEGRDLQDLDDLVEYTQTQVKALPPNLKSKVIGGVQAPLNYDRSFLRRVRGDLDEILSDASRFETARLDRQLRNMLIILAIWEVIVVGITLAVGVPSALAADPLTIFVIFGAAIILGLFGLALLPIRGWLLERAYSRRMFDLKERYARILREALNEIVTYGVQLRRDTAAPFTRLVESQTQLTEELSRELDEAEQAIMRIQRGLAHF
jgi:small GTP-binding protein